MSDLVERLKAAASGLEHDGYTNTPHYLREAAARITELETDAVRWQESRDLWVNKCDEQEKAISKLREENYRLDTLLKASEALKSGYLDQFAKARNSGLEEAAAVCHKQQGAWEAIVRILHFTSFEAAYKHGCVDCVAAIRSLKSQEKK